MKGITQRYTCRRWSFNLREPGYLDPRYVEMQAFYLDTYWFGIRIKRECLFKEEIPVWAWSSEALLGWTEWKSACPPEIWLLCTGKPKA